MLTKNDAAIVKVNRKIFRLHTRPAKKFFAEKITCLMNKIVTAVHSIILNEQ